MTVCMIICTIFTCIFMHHAYTCFKYISYSSRKIKYNWKYLGRPGVPFSVLINDATFSNSLFVLSAVHITQHHCTPLAQRMSKNIAFTHRNNYLKAVHRRNSSRFRGLKIFLFPLLLFTAPSSVYAIHGTNHAVITGASSSDLSR